MKFCAGCSKSLHRKPLPCTQRKNLKRNRSRLRIRSKIGKAQRFESAETAHSFYKHVGIVAAIEPIFKYSNSVRYRCKCFAESLWYCPITPRLNSENTDSIAFVV